MNTGSTGGGIVCRSAHHPSPKLGSLFLCTLFDFPFPTLPPDSRFPSGQQHRAQLGQDLCEHQEPKFCVAGKCKPHFLFLESKFQQWEGSGAEEFCKPQNINIIIQKIPLPKWIAPHTLHPEQNAGTPNSWRCGGWREATILLETGNLMS